jgi:hypothetical protein
MTFCLPKLIEVSRFEEVALGERLIDGVLSILAVSVIYIVIF